MRVWLLVLPLLQASLLTYDGTQSFTESLHFALFHVSWCTHCKQVKPAFTAAALQTSLRFLLVDCEAYADLCKGMKINSKAKLLMILAFDSHDLDSKYNLDPFFALARGYRRQGNRKVQFCFIEAMYSSEQLEPFELSSVPAVIALDVRTEQVLFSVLSAPNSASAEKFTTRILKGEEALTPLELGYYYYAKKIVFAFLSSEFIYENPIFCFLALLSLSVCIGICAGELTKEKEE